jgi:signal transduction histidine kinase
MVWRIVFLTLLALLLGVFALVVIRLRRKVHKMSGLLDQLKDRNIQLDRALRSFRQTYAAERRAFSKDIHDDLGGSLSALKLMLNSLGRNRHGEDFEMIVAMKQHIDETLDSIRRIVLHLQPLVLEAHGLAEAVKEFCYRKNEMKLAGVTFSQEGQPLRLQHDIEFIFYRSVQELVNNAMNHSGAWHIKVEMRWSPVRLDIFVRDDGVGYFKTKTTTSGTGLLNLKSQLYSIGADLTLISEKKGLTANISYPITAQSLALDAKSQ